MPVASKSERTVEIDDDVSRICQLLSIIERLDEAESGSHRTDGMRAGGTDADLEQLEEAGVHEAIVVPEASKWMRWTSAQHPR